MSKIVEYISAGCRTGALNTPLLGWFIISLLWVESLMKWFHLLPLYHYRIYQASCLFARTISKIQHPSNTLVSERSWRGRSSRTEDFSKNCRDVNFIPSTFGVTHTKLYGNLIAKLTVQSCLVVYRNKWWWHNCDNSWCMVHPELCPNPTKTQFWDVLSDNDTITPGDMQTGWEPIGSHWISAKTYKRYIHRKTKTGRAVLLEAEAALSIAQVKECLTSTWRHVGKRIHLRNKNQNLPTN